MKKNTKIWLIAGIIIAEAILILSIFSGYMTLNLSVYGYSERLKNYVLYEEPNSEILREIINRGKIVAIIYSNSFNSKEYYENISKTFYNEVYFFLVKRNISQAIIISPIYENSILNLTEGNLMRELCKASINSPPICTEI
ncbi:MAG: hypothetical protein QW197_00585 [Candidatus Aenigmatarchaeota archaeon]